MIVGKSGRLPYPVDVTCNHSKIDDLIPAFNFIVILNEFVFGFSEVSGLDRDLPYNDIQEGGNPYPVFARKRSYNFEQLNFRKGLLIKKGDWSSDSMKTALSQAAMIPGSLARKAALIAAVSADPVASLENGPAYGFLQVFDRQYKTPLTSFSFFSHGASRWDITDLNASSGDFMYETITLVCSDLKRLSNSALPSGAWNNANQNENESYDIINNENINTNIEELPTSEVPNEQSKTDKLIEAEKESLEIAKLDRKTRLENLKKLQDDVKKKRQEEIKKLNEDFEKYEKSSNEKLIEFIKQNNENFDAEGKSKSELLAEWQKIVSTQQTEKIKKLDEELKEKDKLYNNKLVEEIKKIDKNFSGNNMSTAELFDKWQEIIKAQREEENKKSTNESSQDNK